MPDVLRRSRPSGGFQGVPAHYATAKPIITEIDREFEISRRTQSGRLCNPKINMNHKSYPADRAAKRISDDCIPPRILPGTLTYPFLRSNVDTPSLLHFSSWQKRQHARHHWLANHCQARSLLPTDPDDQSSAGSDSTDEPQNSLRRAWKNTQHWRVASLAQTPRLKQPRLALSQLQ